MTYFSYFLLKALSTEQVISISAVAVVVAVLIALNIWLICSTYKRKKAKQKEQELNNNNARAEAPAAETPANEPVKPAEKPAAKEPVKQVKKPAAKKPVKKAEEPAVTEPVKAVEEPVAEEPVKTVEEPVVKEPVKTVEEPVAVQAVAVEAAEQADDDGTVVAEDGGIFAPHILAAADMSEKMRSDFDLAGKECDDKLYYVRYGIGFEARLRRSDRTVKSFYRSIVDEIYSYKKVKIRKSFRQLRVYKGREVLALLVFKGKKLCIAFALDPAVYAETKYRGKDMSEKKRFQKTPMLLKISTERKLKYAKYLLHEMMTPHGIEQGEVVAGKYDIKSLSRNALYEAGLLRITVLGEVRDNVEVEEPTLVEEVPAEEIVEAPVEEVVEAVEEQEEVVETPAEEEEEPAIEPAMEELPEEEPDEIVEEAPHITQAKPITDKVFKKVSGTVNTDVLNEHFAVGDVITLALLKERALVPKSVTYIKVLFGGKLDKRITVYAHDFSVEALAAIHAVGGSAIKVLFKKESKKK